MSKKGKSAKKARRTVRTTPAAKLLLLILLLGIGWQLYHLRAEVASAQAEKEQLAAQVAAKRQENDALAADIAESGTMEKMEEIARSELGMVCPGEYVFYDAIN